jgi:flagellar hook-associated protein 2
MVQITSSTGIISGIDYATLIDELIKVSSTTKNAITTQNTLLTNQQTAITALMANLSSLKAVTDALGKTALYTTTKATSSNSGVISVKTTGTPTAGSYTYTALSKAQAQTSISSIYNSIDSVVGEGTLSFRFGNGVDTGMSLSDINGGTGFSAGKIKITDRSGSKAVIDLSGAKTIDDVLDAINNNETIDVMASIEGDRIVLTDNTGETGSYLKVQEVNFGTTAASLGILGTAAGDTLTGSDIVYLADKLDLDALNDGIGLETTGSSELADISFTLSDGSTGTISLADATTLGDVIDKINAANTNLKAEISSDKSRLVLTDSSGGSGTFTLSAENYSKALEDLGLTGTAVDGVITGARILSGAKTVLLSDLNGGSGFGDLGTISITDRAGNSANVDLSAAETLEDVIDAINASGLEITAAVNRAGNGIVLTDTSGETTGHLIVANGDATNTADKLGIAIDSAVNRVDSGDLHLQIIGLSTKLTDLHGGAGVAEGEFIITGSSGKSGVVTVDADVTTIGDVVKAINMLSLSMGVYAKINDTGDGIIIQDTAGGTGTLKVTESGSTTAADLNLLGTATTQEIDGETTQVIDGTMTSTIELSDTDTLENLRDRINALNAGVTASIVSNGLDEYYLQISSDTTGAKNSFILDTSQSDISFEQISKAQNALLAFGSAGSSGASVLFSSSTNDFSDVLEGVTLSIKGVSSSAVTVTISSDTSNLAAQIKSFVSSYNTFRTALNTYTEYDVDTQTGSTLTGDYAASRAETDLEDLISSLYVSNDVIRSLAQLGITLDTNADDGTLTLNEDRLNNVLETNLADIKELFTAEDTGISARFSQIIEHLASDDNSLFALRIEALQTTIDRNRDRIDAWTDRLDAERTRLTTQFANLEVILAKLQSNLDYLDSISWITDNSNSNSLFKSTSSS